MKKEPTLSELCKEYRNYRNEESKKISNMSEQEQVKYYAKKQEEVEKLAKENNIKTVSFDEILDEGE